jgi:hypothetical protein
MKGLPDPHKGLPGPMMGVPDPMFFNSSSIF